MEVLKRLTNKNIKSISDFMTFNSLFKPMLKELKDAYTWNELKRYYVGNIKNYYNEHRNLGNNMSISLAFALDKKANDFALKGPGLPYRALSKTMLLTPEAIGHYACEYAKGMHHVFSELINELKRNEDKSNVG